MFLAVRQATTAFPHRTSFLLTTILPVNDFPTITPNYSSVNVFQKFRLFFILFEFYRVLFKSRIKNVCVQFAETVYGREITVD